MTLTIAVSYLLPSITNNETPILKLKNFEKYIPKSSYNQIEILYIIQNKEEKEFHAIEKK